MKVKNYNPMMLRRIAQYLLETADRLESGEWESSKDGVVMLTPEVCNTDSFRLQANISFGPKKN